MLLRLRGRELWAGHPLPHLLVCVPACERTCAHVQQLRSMVVLITEYM